MCDSNMHGDDMEYRAGQIRNSDTTNDAEGADIRLGVVDGVPRRDVGDSSVRLWCIGGFLRDGRFCHSE